MPLDKSIKYRSGKRKRPLLLVTNDDGVDSHGLKTLSDALKRLGDVLIVAPLTEQSAISHSLSLRKPLRLERRAKNLYVIDGTPTDCINIAVNFILKGKRPDILFSGINKGPNMGDDVHYSGTVSAAVEGGIFGIPSVAISTASFSDFKFRAAADFAVRLAGEVLKKGLPKDVILNVNVPNIPSGKIKGYRVTFQGKKNYSNITNENTDPRGDRYYWLSGEEAGFEDIPGSDCNAVADGYVSITPIRVNLTEKAFLKKMLKWKF